MKYVEQPNSSPFKPLLYSYRRCPYAMRARMALLGSKVEFDIYEISLKAKPQEMLEVSSKGTVPVLILNDLILDESLDIMNWAREQNFVNNFLHIDDKDLEEVNKLININDGKFKDKLDCYKYNSGDTVIKRKRSFNDCLFFIEILENKLNQRSFLFSDEAGYADIAIFPFIRQFANVDLNLFAGTHYTNVIDWLNTLVNCNLFKDIMKKI
tara:strand:- start:663 stop:1295 length:633 start_codon:yes stop_codon:yes gene_type:complete